MYLWSLFGYDLMERPIMHGVTDDLAKAMRAVEPQLKDGRAFICVIEEVRMRISVTGLEESYAATGKRWNGRRTTSDGVHWRLSAGSLPEDERRARLPGPLAITVAQVGEMSGGGRRRTPASEVLPQVSASRLASHVR